MNYDVPEIEFFIDKFAKIHRMNPRFAYIMLNTVYISCFAMMNGDNRYRSYKGVSDLVEDVAGEIFEDKEDFVAFLRDKLEEEKLENPW